MSFEITSGIGRSSDVGSSVFSGIDFTAATRIVDVVVALAPRLVSHRWPLLRKIRTPKIIRPAISIGVRIRFRLRMVKVSVHV